MNARLRPAVFSKKRLWLSWMPSDVPPSRQVRAYAGLTPSS